MNTTTALTFVVDQSFGPVSLPLVSLSTICLRPAAVQSFKGYDAVGDVDMAVAVDVEVIY